MKLKDLQRSGKTYPVSGKKAKKAPVGGVWEKPELPGSNVQDMSKMDPLNKRNDMTGADISHMDYDHNAGYESSISTSQEKDPTEIDSFDSANFAGDNTYKVFNYEDDEYASFYEPEEPDFSENDLKKYETDIRFKRQQDPNYPESLRHQTDKGRGGAPSLPYRSGNQYTPPTKPRLRAFLGFPGSSAGKL